MNQTRYYVRVGIALTAAIVLLVLGITLLRGTLTDYRTIGFDVDFKDARGITGGATVQMAGVQIGRVESVRLLTPENVARLHVRVEKRYPIPQGSRFVISTGILAGSPVLTVEPPTKSVGGIVTENDIITGEAAPGLDTAFAKSEKLLDSLQRTAAAVENIATNPRTQEDLRETLHNVRVATGDLPVLSQNVQTQLNQLSVRTNRLLLALERTALSGNLIAQDAGRLTSDLRGTLAENRVQIRALVEDTAGTVSALRGITEQLDETLQEGQIQGNLAAASENLRQMTVRLDVVAGNIERLSSDPRLSSDVRETVTNLRETSSSVRGLAQRIERIRFPGLPGGERPAPLPPTQATLLEAGAAADMNYDLTRQRFRLDTNYTLVGLGGQDFYRFGINDLTGANQLNLQLGRNGAFGNNTALRYGIISGKLGAGVDLQAGPLDLRFDLLDPNRIQMNLRAKTRLTDTISGLAGVEAIGRENRAVIGVQIRR